MPACQLAVSITQWHTDHEKSDSDHSEALPSPKESRAVEACPIN